MPVDVEAELCPVCGYELPHPSPRFRIITLLALAAAAIFITLALN